MIFSNANESYYSCDRLYTILIVKYIGIHSKLKNVRMSEVRIKLATLLAERCHTIHKILQNRQKRAQLFLISYLSYYIQI